MKLRLSSLFIMLACGLVLSCCKNAETPGPAEEQLPTITSTGTGTFGCKVNGKVWVAKSNKTGWPPTYASVNKNLDWYVNITGNIVLNNTEDVVIGLTYYNTFSNYYPLYIKKNNHPSAGHTNRLTNQFWRTDSLTGGAVHISKFDTINQVISGIFYFKCINKETADTLDITDGRFDMHYTY